MYMLYFEIHVIKKTFFSRPQFAIYCRTFDAPSLLLKLKLAYKLSVNCLFYNAGSESKISRHFMHCHFSILFFTLRCLSLIYVFTSTFKNFSGIFPFTQEVHAAILSYATYLVAFARSKKAAGL